MMKHKPMLRMALGGTLEPADNTRSSLDTQMGVGRGLSVGALRVMADERSSLRRDAAERYGIDTTARTADLTSGRQLEGVKYGADQELVGRRYSADQGLAASRLSADASRYGADQQLAGTRISADASKYGDDTRLLGQRMQARGALGGAGGGTGGGAGGSGYGSTNTFDPGAFYDSIPTGFRSADLLAQGRPQSQQNLYPYGRFGELMPGAYGTYDTLTDFNGQPLLRRQDGGEVPGEGKGDKIPAMYEPGEFVVSNDMLKKAPGLREQLHELREEALAEKGMTPAEADAKAVHFGDGQDGRGGRRGNVSLRAINGFPDDWLQGQWNDPDAVRGPAQPVRAAPEVVLPAEPPTGSPTAASMLRDKLVGTPEQWGKYKDVLTKERSVANIPGAKMLGKVAGVAGAGLSAYELQKNLREENYGDAAWNAGDLAAMGALATPAAPLAGGYLGVRAVSEAPGAIREALGPDRLETLGGTINSALRKFGLGVDDSALHEVNAQYGSKQQAERAAAAAPKRPNRPMQPRSEVLPDDVLPGSAETVSEGDLRRHQDTVNNLLGRTSNADERMIRMQLEPGTRAAYNKSLRDIGNDVRVTTDANGGLLLTSATGDDKSTKMRYRDVDGNPTNDWSKTKAYFDNQSQTQRIADAADRMTYDRMLRDSQSPWAATREGAKTALGAMEQRRATEATSANARLQALAKQAEMQYTRFNDQRNFDLKATEANQKMREEGDKAWTNELNARFTTKDKETGKVVPDTEAVAHIKNGTQAFLQNLITAAEKRGDTAAAEEIRTKGPNILDANTREKLILGLEAQRRLAGAHSTWDPFGANHVHNPDPMSYVITGKNEGPLQNQYRFLNGSTGPTRLFNYQQGGNPFLPNWAGDVPSTMFAPIKQLRE